jgi:hypothetical protein
MWQHNVLHTLWKYNQTAVPYVAPLFHTRTHMDLLESSPYYRYCPLQEPRDFHRSKISIGNVSVNAHETCRIPFFDGLISIPPHKPVKALKHNYAFTSHRDITFHSTPELVEGGKLFGETLRQFVSSSMRPDGPPKQDKVELTYIRDILGNLGEDSDFLNAFLAFGLSQIGVDYRENPTQEKWRDVEWLQQRVALSASLKAYFGISTIGLLKVKEQ